MQDPVPPLTDRSKAKEIEKIQKYREKLWQKQLKEDEKAMKKQQKEERRRSRRSSNRSSSTSPTPRYTMESSPPPPPVVEEEKTLEEEIKAELAKQEIPEEPAGPTPEELEKEQTEKRWENAQENFGEVKKLPHEKPKEPEPEPEPPKPKKTYLVAGTPAKQYTKEPDTSPPEEEHPNISNHILPTADDGRSVEQRRTDAMRNLARNNVNEQARGDPSLIGRPSTYDLDSAEFSRQTGAQDLASSKVNEQARGAPELIGKPNKFDLDAAEMKRLSNVPKLRKANPQIPLDDIVSRDKPADASWSGTVILCMVLNFISRDLTSRLSNLERYTKLKTFLSHLTTSVKIQQRQALMMKSNVGTTFTVSTRMKVLRC